MKEPRAKAFKESPKARRARIRHRYETSELTLRELAPLEGVSESSVMKWSQRYKWRKRSALVTKSTEEIEAEVNAKATEMVRDELAPLIAKAKEQIVKRGIRLGNRGLTRVEKLWRSSKPESAKDEADSGRAVETFVRIVRQAAGMDDGKASSGSVNLNVLTNQAAIQVVGPS